MGRPTIGYVARFGAQRYGDFQVPIHRRTIRTIQCSDLATKAIAKYTVTVDLAGRIRSVKPRHVRGRSPEHIKWQAKEINDLRPAFAKAHAQFVRLVNKRLRDDRNSG